MRPERIWDRSPVPKASGFFHPFSHPWVERLSVASLLAIILSVSFHGLAWWNAHRLGNDPYRWNLETSIDRNIAFSPIWVWVYLSYFPACTAPIFCRELWRNIHLFRRTALGYAVQFGLALPCFLMPFQMIRPQLSTPASWTDHAMTWVYQLDPGYNIFPSLHVSNTVFLACWMWRVQGWKIGAAFWIVAALITWSTLAVKQHYFVDLPTGFLLGALSFHLCFRKGPPRQ